MGIDRDRIKPFGSPLVGFGREQVQPIRIILLPMTARTAPKLFTVMVNFLVVDRPFTCNAIIGQPALNKLRAATSTYHLMMKFPIEEGVREVRGDQVAAWRCYNISMKWRMCVDLTNLNKAYNKDNFPLLCINTLVDSTSGYQLLSFMDAFSSYN
jgi:hypothetical protein